jgi:hypothetical protein
VKHPQRIAYRRLFVSRCGFVARICQISPDVQSKLDFNRAFQTHHLNGRRHIPRQSHWLTNWRDYDVALRNRGSLTVWFRDILRSREDVRREYQAKIAVNALNRMLERGCPICVRVA